VFFAKLLIANIRLKAYNSVRKEVVIMTPVEDKRERLGSFGERLQRVRRERGFSQSELAERAGVPIDTIQNWEIGRTEPRLLALIKVAKGLAVSLDVLAGLKAQKQRQPREENDS
jgi:DNA-binding XRE family transcriptional regulator